MGLGWSGCATQKQQGKGLRSAVNSYHDNLRWKRLSAASKYRVAEKRAGFMERYLAVEDDLSIDTIEVRDVTFLPESEPLTANVVVTAEAYLLPSTVLRKHVITERWEQRGEVWRLVESSLELAPPSASARQTGTSGTR